MTSSYADPAHIVTVEVERNQADRIAEELTALWNRAPVRYERPSHCRVWLEFYFATEVASLLARAVMAGHPGIVASTCHRSEAREWEAAFRSSFHRRDVGRRLRICPVWERAEAPADGRATVLIDPGLSFGTGEHFTTAFCLERMDDLWLKSQPPSFLDVGSGSGILDLAEWRLVLSGIREPELEGVSEVFRTLGAHEVCRDGDGEWGGLVLATGETKR